MEDTTARESFVASVDRHVEAEGRILEEYRALAEKIPDGPIGMLVDLILTEEEQHHFLLRTMAKHLTCGQVQLSQGKERALAGALRARPRASRDKIGATAAFGTNLDLDQLRP